MPLLDHLEEHLHLGIRAIDQDHREFVDLIRRMAASGDAAFVYLYNELLEHTRGHLANEDALLRQADLPSTAEHLAEHAWLLAELEHHGKALRAGRIAPVRTFITQHLPFWFARHIRERDSALAQHLKSTRPAGRPPAPSAPTWSP